MLNPRNRTAFLWLVAILLTTGLSATAQTPEPETPATAPAPAAQTTSQPPMVRRTTTSLVRGLTDKVDDIFGTERADENRRFSTLRFSVRHRIVDGGPNQTTTAIRLTLRPATLDHWQGQVNEWLKRKKTRAKDRLWRPRDRNTPPEVAEQTDEYGEPLNPEQVEEVRDPWRPAFEHRFRFDRDNFYEGRMKATKDLELGNTMNHGVFEVRWSNQRQWENVTSGITSYPLTDDLLFQFSNVFNWQITGRSFESSHGPSLAYTISSTKAISLSFNTAVGYEPWWVEVYTLSSVYRQHIYEDWIDISINPFRSYARFRNFEPETGVVLNAEVLF